MTSSTHRRRSGHQARQRSDRGQATVELALTLPVVVILLLGLVQAGTLARDQILVTHAAREAARAAAVVDDRSSIVQAATGAGPLDRRRLTVEVGARGAPGTQITVKVSYATATRVPLIGDLVPDVTLHAQASMRVEQ
jgi:Flp pilus assembly protein TadG